ncbi:MAG TPA: DNA repair protein RecO [Gemmatimonadaceae bacterium]|jgi:DNA repair protein RecO (recombination protein O)|nr:DNA repair protein RecO [Gemmatimonadaceae bacterium]
MLVTDAIVLHSLDYLESSRILRLVTREAGVRSVLARGARKSKKRFGAALDLYAEGTAELQIKPGRDLDTLSGFEVTRARPQLAGGLARFAGASMLAELTLRFARDDADPALYETIATTFDALGTAGPERVRDMALGGAWRVLAALGVEPTIDACAECDARVDPGAPAIFSHPAGGVLCPRCGHLARSGRTLPPAARDALRDWLAGVDHALTDADTVRAHQRLLREFLREHLADERPLRAFDVWERDVLTAGAPA